MLKVSGSLALWIWLSVLALYLLLSVCLQVPVLFSGFTLVLYPWLSWLVRVVEQYVVGNKLGLLLGWWGGGRHYCTYMCHTSKLDNFWGFLTFLLLCLVMCRAQPSLSSNFLDGMFNLNFILEVLPFSNIWEGNWSGLKWSCKLHRKQCCSWSRASGPPLVPGVPWDLFPRWMLW